MARNFLSIPSTTTGVERIFSRGRHLLHYPRNRMSSTSIAACLVLGSWCRQDLLKTSELMAAVSESRGGGYKRKRGAPDAEVDN